MSQAPAVYNAAERIEALPTVRAVELSQDDLEVLRATVFKGATDAQLALYARTCRSRGLDPFSKEIYAWAGRDGAVEIVVGIDGLRNLAESTGEYRGQVGPLYCGEDGLWTEVWLRKEPPLAAKVTVLRQGREPMTDIALLAEFKRNTPNWNGMPTRMLAKTAEANAIRRQFPRQTTGLYIREELERDDPPAAPRARAVEAAVVDRPMRPRRTVAGRIRELIADLAMNDDQQIEFLEGAFGKTALDRLTGEEGKEAIRLLEHALTARLDDGDDDDAIEAEYEPEEDASD